MPKPLSFKRDGRVLLAGQQIGRIWRKPGKPVKAQMNWAVEIFGHGEVAQVYSRREAVDEAQRALNRLTSGEPPC